MTGVAYECHEQSLMHAPRLKISGGFAPVRLVHEEKAQRLYVFGGSPYLATDRHMREFHQLESLTELAPNETARR